MPDLSFRGPGLARGDDSDRPTVLTFFGGNRAASEEEALRADHVRTEAELDTGGDTVERSLAKLVRIVQRCLEGDAPPRRAAPRGRGNAKPRP